MNLECPVCGQEGRIEDGDYVSLLTGEHVPKSEARDLPLGQPGPWFGFTVESDRMIWPCGGYMLFFERLAPAPPHRRGEGDMSAPVWTSHGDVHCCTCSRCGDVAVLFGALRAVRVLHTGEHYCGSPGDEPPYLWTETPWPSPCPTAVIIDATLAGYGRGGPWPYTEQEG